jgi:DNA-binding response OmpR family regulator
MRPPLRYNHPMKVLVVEDEREVAGLIKKGLDELGIVAEVSHHGDEALALATSRQYDAIVLDIMLPGRDGLSILKSLRRRRNSVPVILLTARSEVEERVEGLDLGADDYVTKPFYVEELISRIQAVVRRATGHQLSLLQSGDFIVNLITHEAKRGDRSIRLTAREFGLLEYLMRSPGRVYTRTQIIEHVFGYDFDPNTNLVDVYIQRLRKKIMGASDSDLIETVRGVGYRFLKP